EQVLPELRPVRFTPGSAPFLRNRGIYLVAALASETATEPEFGLVEIPAGRVARFVSVADRQGRHLVLFVDDLIRLQLPQLFPGASIEAVHSVKLSRDAELYVEEELTALRSEAIRRALGKRETGLPTRFLIDRAA